MKLLILGGTRFLGRFLVESALARKHQVTLFNRGQTSPELFPKVEKLRGDRDGNLQALEGRKWDAVIDTCGFVSRQVRSMAMLLAGALDHYTFISSISVYKDFAKSGLDESAPLEQLPAGVGEDVADAGTYGARKVLCERAAENAMPGRVLIIRPGMIVGPHDTTGRFLYWVRRMASGAEVLAPGNSDGPVQLIDVRDLAAWIIQMVESRNVGKYNATGPNPAMTFQELLEQCAKACGRRAQLTWVDERFLLEQGIKPFTDLPFWLPTAHKGFFEIDCGRAICAGLRCRPLVETVSDTFAWGNSVKGGVHVGLDAPKERELLQLWKNKCVGADISKLS